MRIQFVTESGDYLFSDNFDFSPVGITIKTDLNGDFIVKELIYETSGLTGIVIPKEQPSAKYPSLHGICPSEQHWRKMVDLWPGKLAIVKYVKEAFNVGLKEAKDYVDEYEYLIARSKTSNT